MGKVGKAVIVIGGGAKLAVKYGPQVKIAWDNGGKKAAAAAARRRALPDRPAQGVRPCLDRGQRLGAQGRSRRDHGVRRLQRRAADRDVPTSGAATRGPPRPRRPLPADPSQTPAELPRAAGGVPELKPDPDPSWGRARCSWRATTPTCSRCSRAARLNGRPVDVIYIDPPYNTGNDFAYNDKHGTGPHVTPPGPR